MDKIDIEIICKELPKIIKEKTVRLETPTYYNICKINPKICQLAPFLSKNYALLYSGGINASNAHSRYWNDLKFMYKTLKSKYGYQDNQIVVVYKDGVAADAEMPVNYAASVVGLKDAMNYLNSKMTTRSNLFFFITNHGGGYNTSDNTNYSGITDAVPKDEVDPYGYDETVFYYNAASNAISDDTLAAMFNRLKFKYLVSLLEPCFSGGLLRDLRGNNRVLASAANEFEFSWGGAPGNHDLFSYYFTCALNGADHNGAVVNADTNSDGKVSFLEAFLYAKNHDTSQEQPLLEDSGDGVGINNPSASGTSDGAKASNIFL